MAQDPQGELLVFRKSLAFSQEKSTEKMGIIIIRDLQSYT